MRGMASLCPLIKCNQLSFDFTFDEKTQRHKRRKLIFLKQNDEK